METSMMENKLTLKEKLLYGQGSLGKDLYMGFISFYLMIYLTDVFGISALAVGTLFFVARIWDAVNDPMMGVLADKTKTPWGRYRPYSLFVPFIAAIAFILMLSSPELSDSGKLIWAYVTYIVVGMAYTALDVSMMSMVPTFTSDSEEKTSILAFQRWFAFLAFVIAAMCTIPLVEKLGGGNEVLGYRYYGYVIAGISIISSLTMFFHVKEKRDLGDLPVNNMKDYWFLLKENKPFQKVVGIRIAYDFGMQISSGITAYWVIYYLQKPDLISIIMPISFGTGLIGFLFIPKIIQKIGKKKASIYGFWGLIIGSVIKLFFSHNVAIIIISLVIIGFAIALLNLSNISMVADTAEYAQWKTGKRSDSLLFAMNTFAYKISMAFAGGVTGVILALANYVPNVEQTQQTLTVLNLMFSIGPVIFLLIGLWITGKYTLTEEKYQEIIQEI